MRKNLNKLRTLSFQFRAVANHYSHNALKQDGTRYGEAITQSKQKHWENFLEEMSASEIWTANKYLKEPAGDGSLPRIPSLKTTNKDGLLLTTEDNTSKATLLAKMFFLPPPDNLNNDNHPQEDYPNPLPDPPTITKEQILTHIANLSPHKAPGPDGIPNIVLKESSEIITAPLTNIYKV